MENMQLQQPKTEKGMMARKSCFPLDQQGEDLESVVEERSDDSLFWPRS